MESNSSDADQVSVIKFEWIHSFHLHISTFLAECIVKFWNTHGTACKGFITAMEAIQSLKMNNESFMFLLLKP